MANVMWLRKMASDELMDTLFFSSGERVRKEKFPKFTSLKCPGYEVKVTHTRLIEVNGRKCLSVPEAKRVIQDLIY